MNRHVLVDASSTVSYLPRTLHLPLRKVNTGSDLVTNLDEGDVVGNVEARVYLQHHLENAHSNQQQLAEKKWSKLERNYLQHFHTEELFYDKRRLKHEHLNHERPGAQRLVDQDTMSMKWTTSQRPFSFSEQQSERFRGSERTSFDRANAHERSLQLQRLNMMVQPRPNEMM